MDIPDWVRGAAEEAARQILDQTAGRDRLSWWGTVEAFKDAQRVHDAYIRDWAASDLKLVQCAFCGGTLALGDALYHHSNNGPDTGPLCDECAREVVQMAREKGWA